jgi:hypothetical protein
MTDRNEEDPSLNFILCKLGVSCLGFILAFSWVLFAGPAPKTTVTASFLWLAPLLVSIITSIAFWIIQINSKGIKDLQKHGLNLITTAAMTVALFLILAFLFVSLISLIVGDLKPLDPESNEEGSRWIDWIGAMIVSMLFTGIGGALLVVLWSVPIDGFEKWREARKAQWEDKFEMESRREGEEPSSE